MSTAVSKFRISLGLAALCGLLFVTAARADVANNVVVDGIKAARDFNIAANTLIKSDNRMPALSDEKTAAILRRLWNGDALSAGRPESQDGIASLMQWSKAAGIVTRRYILFNSQSENRDQVKTNTVTYQDELTLGLSFSLRMSVNLMQGTLDRLNAAPKKKTDADLAEAAKDRVRDSAMTALQGIMSLLKLPELKPDNAKVLGALLGDELPRLQPIMTPDMTTAIETLAKDAAITAKSEEAQAALKSIAAPQAAADTGTPKPDHIDRRSE